MRKNLIKLIATFFFVGCMPLMPGTWGTLAGVIVYLLVRHSIYLSLAAFISVLFLGFFTAGKAEDIFGKKDDKRIVIDEVCGILLLYILIPQSPLFFIAGFALFRLFDIFKVYPAGKLERLPGAWGIMADDILSALYSYLAVCVFLIARTFLK